MYVYSYICTEVSYTLQGNTRVESFRQRYLVAPQTCVSRASRTTQASPSRRLVFVFSSFFALFSFYFVHTPPAKPSLSGSQRPLSSLFLPLFLSLFLSVACMLFLSLDFPRFPLPCSFFVSFCIARALSVALAVFVFLSLQWNLDGLLEKIWLYLDLVRVYTKPKGQIPDYNAPVILNSRMCRVEDFCVRIHKSLLEEFKHAIVWGRSVKHNPQKVGKDHELVDEDVVQIVKR